MKNAICIFLLCAWFSVTSSAQTIPNGGFESWTMGNPTGWATSNIPSFYEPVTQSNSAHSGSFAVQGTVVPGIMGIPYIPLLAVGEDGGGFPISSRPQALRGWYKFAPDSGDVFSVTILLSMNDNYVGGGAFSSPMPRSIYTEFVADIMYVSNDIPDTAYIIVLIANDQSAHTNSQFTMDDLSFGPATGVKETGAGAPHSFALDQNYPNPFNPTTMIQFHIGEAQLVTLNVYNLLGQEVTMLVNQQLPPGRYRAEFDASNVPGGTYFYRLNAGHHSEVKKMVVLK